jgi:hypothetical protein
MTENSEKPNDMQETEHCYPYRGRWLRSSHPTQTNTGFYDVALWRSWPPHGLACIVEHVQAVSGFAAIRKTMQANGLRSVAHASAAPCGGQWFEVYRAFGIRLHEKPHQPVWLAMFC